MYIPPLPINVSGISVALLLTDVHSDYGMDEKLHPFCFVER